MNQAHLHLLITHLPIFGSIIGALVLGYGLWTKSNHTKNAAYFIFIISAIGAGIAYLTGEGAEDAVEHIQGVTENLIEIHEDAALNALISLIVLGGMSVIALIMSRFKTSFTKFTSTIILLLSLISFGLVARTGYLGGKIRHTEISTDAIQNNHGGEAGEKDDD
jgi:uncharacterized membrane protein